MSHVNRLLRVIPVSVRVQAILGLIVVGTLGFNVAPASAEKSFLFSFNGEHNPYAGLSGPNGVAVDQSSGDVYVADQGNGVVEKYGALGEYLSELTEASPNNTTAYPFSGGNDVAVDNSGEASKGDVYVTELSAKKVDKFNTSGEFVSALTEASPNNATPYPFMLPAGVGVDPANGEVFVADYEANAVDIFNTSGEFVKAFPAIVNGPNGVAFNSTGSDVYINEANEGHVQEFSVPSGASVAVIDNKGDTQAVAVDPLTNDVYVD